MNRNNNRHFTIMPVHAESIICFSVEDLMQETARLGFTEDQLVMLLDDGYDVELYDCDGLLLCEIIEDQIDPHGSHGE